MNKNKTQTKMKCSKVKYQTSSGLINFFKDKIKIVKSTDRSRKESMYKKKETN